MSTGNKLAVVRFKPEQKRLLFRFMFLCCYWYFFQPFPPWIVGKIFFSALLRQLRDGDFVRIWAGVVKGTRQLGYAWPFA